MNRDTTVLVRADSSESAAPSAPQLAFYRRALRRLKNDWIYVVSQLARKAARFAMRWQADFTFRQAIVHRRRSLNQRLHSRSGGVVDGGPFKGMQLSPAATWGDGDLAAKLLGCYEQELHAEIESFAESRYDNVIVVGCAEGYYAIGLGRRFPHARVIAFETAVEGQRICRENAALNGLADRMDVLGNCTVATLRAALAGRGKALLLLDCEGAERDLLDPHAVPETAACDFIVECHDHLDCTITDALVGRFDRTHAITTIHESGRNPNGHRLLEGLRGIDRSLAVCECRNEPMHWLVARHRS